MGLKKIKRQIMMVVVVVLKSDSCNGCLFRCFKNLSWRTKTEANVCFENLLYNSDVYNNIIKINFLTYVTLVAFRVGLCIF